MTRKERLLPLSGKVLVSVGMDVKAETAVAKTELPGSVDLVNVAAKLDISPADLKKTMIKRPGDEVSEGEIIARASGLFGLFSSQCISPVSGVIESLSEATGKVAIRQKPIPVELKAYVDGKVDSIISDKGVVIRTWGAVIQGIFGHGGETFGILRGVVSQPGEMLAEEKISEQFSGSIMVGDKVSWRIIEKAKKCGVRAVIAGAMEADDFNAIATFHEITVILTEGFGSIPMAQRTFDLLKSCEGRKTSVNGMTQIRAGVIRPEIIVPFLEEEIPTIEESRKILGLAPGSSVRVIQGENFGQIGSVVSLPIDPVRIETEAQVRAAEVKLSSGEKCIVPRANLECLS